MHSNFPIKNHFKEENDFFLSYVNDKLNEIDHHLATLEVDEQKGFANNLDQFIILNNKITLLNNRKEFEHMKDHYYLALNYGRSKNNNSLLKKIKKPEKDFFSEEQKYNLTSLNIHFQNKMKLNPDKLNEFQMNKEGMDLFPKSLLICILNLIHVAKFIKHLKNQDEFFNYLGDNNLKIEEINKITTFYKSCFSKSANKNFLTNEAKLLFCNNMLEIYCYENHPLHNHFQGMREKIEIIGKSPFFLSKNPNDKSNVLLPNNQNPSKNDLQNLSGSQSDDTRRVIKKNFHKNKANLDNYDGDSEKSIHKSEREEVKEENEEEFIENRAKSDGENNENNQGLELEQILNKPKFKNNHKPKINKFRKNRKLKKMFDDSGDHATGSASDKNYEDSKTKLFSWGIRGLQKNNNRPPKGFDTDKDMKL